MSTTVIAMYESADKAQQPIKEIVRSGVSHDEIDLLHTDREGDSRLVDDLTQRGLGEQEAVIYAAEIGKGAAMVAVEATDDAAQDTFEIMNRFGARNLEQLVLRAAGSQDSVPIVEEQVSIGKRRVLRGGVRVTSVVSERPVEETVTLTEDKVAVDRHQTNRKLSPEEAEAAFEPRTLELAETTEEAVISKEARVVGEVSLAKKTAQRQETVQATARRTDVKVEKIDAREVVSSKE